MSADGPNLPGEPTRDLASRRRDAANDLLDAIVREHLRDSRAYARRRDALVHLRELGGRTTLSELAAAIASSRSGGQPGDEDDAAARIAVSLHHADLPSLATSGLVSYDWDERTVELAFDPSQRDRFASSTSPDRRTRDD
jgi:hypothetical protein